MVVSVAGCRCKAAGELTVNGRGEYVYMQDLHVLDSRRPLRAPLIPEGVGVVSSLVSGRKYWPVTPIKSSQFSWCEEFERVSESGLTTGS